MLLRPDEAERFFRLHCSLMCFVNARLRVVPDVATPEQFSALSPEVRLKVRQAFLGQRELVDSFVEENPCGLSEDDLEIVRSWRHLVADKLFLFRYLKKYAIFLDDDDPPVAYGVTAINDPIEFLCGPDLPVLVETVLLPFGDKIIYDGMIQSFNISFGGGIKRRLNESYKEAKERLGIVTSLPVAAQPLGLPQPQTPAKRRPASRSSEVDAYLEVIVGMTDEFCRQNLNEEYAALCRKLAEKLSRKRPSPLLRGQPKTWACGIVRAIGWVNFLHDKAQSPHMRLIDIDYCFDVAESTGAAKLAEIRKMCRLHQLDPAWTLPSRRKDNAFPWPF